MTAVSAGLVHTVQILVIFCSVQIYKNLIVRLLQFVEVFVSSVTVWSVRAVHDRMFEVFGIWRHLEREQPHEDIRDNGQEQRGQKSRNVFHIASQKSFKVKKKKAKPVTTNLKKVKIVNDEKVNRVNKPFIDIQKELAHFSKGLSLEPLQKQLIPEQCHEDKPVNVEATRLMA
ncbi:ribosomal biogenesis factor-like [Vicugna pacos]|uniref:Ribosomal biogenesis factor-like n=1 Tax=Vicugna pacos TaxID=30538 RepID=A0ABM5BID5_VICPA